MQPDKRTTHSMQNRKAKVRALDPGHVTQTQTRTQLARVWLEYESSGIKLSVSGV